MFTQIYRDMIKSFTTFMETFTPKKLDRTLIKDLDKFKVELQKLLTYKLTQEDLDRITDFHTAQDVLFDNDDDLDVDDWDDESEVEAAETEQANTLNAIIYKAISNSNKMVKESHDLPMLDLEDQRTVEELLYQHGIEIGSANLRPNKGKFFPNESNSIDFYLPNQNLDLIVTVNKKYELEYKVRHHNRAVILTTTDPKEAIKAIKQHQKITETFTPKKILNRSEEAKTKGIFSFNIKEWYDLPDCGLLRAQSHMSYVGFKNNHDIWNCILGFGPTVLLIFELGVAESWNIDLKIKRIAFEKPNVENLMWPKYLQFSKKSIDKFSKRIAMEIVDDLQGTNRLEDIYSVKDMYDLAEKIQPNVKKAILKTYE